MSLQDHFCCFCCRCQFHAACLSNPPLPARVRVGAVYIYKDYSSSSSSRVMMQVVKTVQRNPPSTAARRRNGLGLASASGGGGGGPVHIYRKASAPPPLRAATAHIRSLPLLLEFVIRLMRDNIFSLFSTLLVLACRASRRVHIFPIRCSFPSVHVS